MSDWREEKFCYRPMSTWVVDRIKAMPQQDYSETFSGRFKELEPIVDVECEDAEHSPGGGWIYQWSYVARKLRRMTHGGVVDE